MSTVGPVRAGNAFEETLAQLLRAIRLGEFMVGEKLPPERDLARALGVSRATLREVLHALKETGIVEVTRGRYGGTVVIGLPKDQGDLAAVDPAELADALAFRAVLETAAARIVAAAALTAAQRQALRSACEECGRAEPAEYRAFDSRFHLTLAELTGIPSLRAAAAGTRDRVNALLDRIPLLQTNLDHANDQHALLVDAVLSGDVEAAVRHAEDHAQGTAALLHGYLLE